MLDLAAQGDIMLKSLELKWDHGMEGTGSANYEPYPAP